MSAPAKGAPGILWLGKRHTMGKDLLAERYGRYYEIPRQLALQGFRVHALLLSYRGEPPVVVDHAEGLTFESIDLRRGWRYLARARKLAKQGEFSVVVGGSDMPFGVLADRLGHAAGLPVVHDLYDNYDLFASARIPGLAWRYGRALDRAAANVVFTEVLAEHLAERHPQARFEIVSNSVDRDLFRPLDRSECRQRLGLPADGLLIGYFGAIQADRGLETLFDAVAQLRRDGLPAELVIAGANDGTFDLDSLEGVRPLGHRPHHEVPWLLNACDLNVNCLRDNAVARTCFPFKTVEYAACRVPFAVPDVESMRRYLKDYPEYLYRLGDAADLARAVRQLLTLENPTFPEVDRWSDVARAYGRVLDSVV